MPSPGSKPNSPIPATIARLAANVTVCAYLAGLSRSDIFHGSVLHEQARKADHSLNDRLLAPIAYGALLLIISLFKAYGAWKLSRESNSRLVLVLIRDQVAYYIL